MNEEITMGLKEELIDNLEEPCRSASEVKLVFVDLSIGSLIIY